MSIYRPTIETLDDWNAAIAACGCCEMPECPVPVQECESLTGSARTNSANRNTDDTTWTRYTSKVRTATVTVSGSTTEDDVGGIGEYTSATQESAATYTETTEWSKIYDTWVGTCQVNDSVETGPVCGGDGTYTLNSYDLVGVMPTEGNPDPACSRHAYLSLSHTITRTLVPDETETEEHAQWVIDNAAYQQYLLDYAQWEIDWAAWDAGGQIGDEPIEPDFVADPGEEPTEFYPPCTFKDSNTVIDYEPGAPGGDACGSGESTTETYDEYVYAGSLPNVGSILQTYYSDLIGVDSVTSDETEYFGGQGYDAVVAAMVSELDTLTSFSTPENEPCVGADCSAIFSVTPEPETNASDVTMSLRRIRYRWTVPDTWTGSYFKVTWDVVEEPDGWDADPPTALRSFVSQDNTWTWAGPGDPEDADSWKSGWYEIDPPPAPGTRRVVNIRFECYRNSPYGNKPQITGDSADPAGGQHDGSNSLTSFTQPLR